MTKTDSNLLRDAVTGVAAGVPFVALPPAGGPGADAPVVLAWHLQDPPRTETAFAAALPLNQLDAWRIYLGLPLSGSRLPDGGVEEVMRLGGEDAVLNVYQPAAYGAIEEAAPAFAEIKRQVGLGDGPIGVMGASIGGVIAQLVIAEGVLDVQAAVLVNPMVQLREVVGAGERYFGVTYDWTAASNAVADRLDLLQRADELRAKGANVLMVLGDQDDIGITRPAAALMDRLVGGAGATELVWVPGMAHALAEDPGMEPAPQTVYAAEVDRLAMEWFRQHLV